MRSELAALDNWIDGAKHDLPRLDAKLRSRQACHDHAGAEAVQRQINLIESILEHHRMVSRADLEGSDLYGLLEAMRHGIQHCSQMAVEAQEDNQLTGCLVALATIDRLMRGLRASDRDKEVGVPACARTPRSNSTTT